jgi:uncharacterized membrane protein YjjP (DUF1212 family)
MKPPALADSQELQTIAPASSADPMPPALSAPLPAEGSSRTRVRINSVAAEIPPPPASRSPSHLSEPRLHQSQSVHLSPQSSESSDHERSTAAAEELLRAHHTGHGEADVDYYCDNTVEDSDTYAATGSAQGGIFYQLLQAYKTPTVSHHYAPSDASASTAANTPPTVQRPGTSSGAATPSRKKWYQQEKATQPHDSHETLATLIGASAKLANPNDKKVVDSRPRHKRTNSSGLLKAWKSKEDQDARIKIHVADILKRQQYIIRMCRALMLFGAPTHRLEEYLAMTAKVLEINSQFLYIPGCMLISFDDVLTRTYLLCLFTRTNLLMLLDTAEVKIVRTAQGVNLGKLKDTHEIYKEVLHDVISLDEALGRLDQVINASDRHPVWLCVIMYGLASAAVSVFFQARLIDMPIILAMGCLLGLLQLVIAPLSKTYSTVFEISATILMSFLARAFGSINGGGLFCFSAIAQSAIAMILPGWVRMRL